MDRTGPTIHNIRRRIQEIRQELDSMEEFEEIPELIESANLLRSNELLKRKTDKQEDLLQAYAEYSGALEEMLSDVFDIQNDLKDVIQAQLDLMSKPRPKKRTQKTKA